MAIKIKDISVFGETFDAGEVRLGFDRDFFTLSEFFAERYFGGNLLARGSYPSNKEKMLFLKSYSQIYRSVLYKGFENLKTTVKKAYDFLPKHQEISFSKVQI